MLIFAALFLAYAVVASTPASLLKSTHETLAAAASLSVSIAPNPYNTMAQQFAQKETQLSQKEAQLNTQQEQLSSSITTNEKLGFYSLCMSVLLFVLVGVNFLFDIRRGRGGARGTYSIDLR